MRSLFKHSPWDALLLACTIFQLVFNLWLVITWDSRGLLQNFAFFPIMLFVFWYNALIATHNFVHTPWFKVNALNSVHAVFNSANLGFPVTHYRYIHFNHHQYGNDRQDSNGNTQDWSSTFANGKNGQHENVISYCALAIFRDDVLASFRQAKKQRDVVQLSLESAACCLAALGYLVISWQFFLFFYLPVFYLGWFFTYLANYYEHFGAAPGNLYADSTSYYDRTFNLFFCNEGYHQEHHLRPNVHWTKRHQIYQDFREKLDGVERTVLKFPHVLGFLHHRDRSEISNNCSLP